MKSTSDMVLREGQAYSQQQVDQSLKTLYGTGLFADVQILQSNGTVTVKVVENPIINRIAFEGNSKVSQKTLDDEVQLKPRMVFTRAKVQAYFQRRLGRLGPLFAAAVTLSLAGKLLVSGRDLDGFVTLANLSLLFGFVSPAATPVVGGWSIGVEVVFYVVFPLLLLLRNKAHYIVAASVFMAAWVARDLQSFDTLAQGWQLYVLPANHAVFFAAGAYMRAFDTRVAHVGTTALAGLCMALLVVMGMAAAGASELQLVTGWRRLVLVTASLAFVGLAARLPLESVAARVATLFGGLSYPLYLIHPIVYFSVRDRVEMAVPVVLALLALTIALAIITDRWLDTPVQRRVKALGW